MNSARKTAIIVGILLIVCTATTILSLTLINPILDGPQYLTKVAENEIQVVIAAILEFVWAATAMGIAIWLFPMLRKHNEALSLGSVSFRVVEGMFVFVGTLSLLSLLTLSKGFAGAEVFDPGSFKTVGILLLAMRQWTLDGIVLIAFCIGALLYYCVFYQSRLIPRWLAVWGIFGATLSLAVTLFSLFNPDFVVSWVHTLLNAPIAFQEMVLAVWLIAKGFNPSIIDATSASIGVNEED
jgi:hypothetical protein